MPVESVNPATGRVIARYERHAPGELERRLQQTADEQRVWRETALADRAARFRSIARRLRERAPVIAELIAELEHP